MNPRGAGGATLPVWTAREAQAADRRAAAMGIAESWLMESAGAAVARRVQAWGASKPLILVGSGRNGGDGLVAARRLALAGRPPRVFMPAPPRFAEAAQLTSSAWAAGAAPVAAEQLGPSLAWADLVVDAVLGTGQRAPLQPPWDAWWPKLSGQRILAVDLPTGVNADTGQVWGPLPRGIVETVAIAALKPAHLLPPAAAAMGRISVADIGLGAEPGRELQMALPDQWPAGRAEDDDKYARGTLMIIGGSARYSGAPGLAAAAAMRAGMGYAEIWCAAAGADRIRFLPAVVRVLPESAEGALLLSQEAEAALGRAGAVVLGPGATVHASLLEAVRRARRPVVVDAGAFAAYVAVGRPRWPEAVFTPHVREAARLLAVDPTAVSADRRAALRQLTDATGGVVLLKGRRTLIGQGEGPAYANWPGGPELATAGSGDVLAGIIGSLLARGLDPLAAARLGAWWHGAAGLHMRWAYGPSGGSAEDLTKALAGALPLTVPADWPEWVW